MDILPFRSINTIAAYLLLVSICSSALGARPLLLNLYCEDSGTTFQSYIYFIFNTLWSIYLYIKYRD